MKKYDYLLVGGGLFSAVFAHRAVKSGKKCLVAEKRGQLGGNLYCDSIEGINVHRYGPHIFHTSDTRVWKFVNNVTEFNRYTNCPLACYKGEIYNMPFNMNTFNKMWGVRTPAEAKAIIDRQRAAVTGEPANLEEQAISLVGEDIYKKLIKGYTEKQWGRSCKELPSFIIKRLPVRYVYDNNYFNDRYQGIPVGGYNVMISRLFEGCDIMLDTDYNADRENLSGMAEKTLYTGTIDSLFDYCFGKLEYRSLKFETEVLDTENYQGVAVVNYTEREIPYTRIIEHKHFESAKSEKTVITREYPVSWEEGMEPYYPMNDGKNNRLFEKYRELASEKENMLFGGRLAEYRYYDMDKVVASALALADSEFGASDE